MASREPVLAAATADGSRDRVATDGGGIVVAEDEDKVLETDDVETNNEGNCACSPLPGDYPCATCYISGAKAWPDEKNGNVDRHGSR